MSKRPKKLTCLEICAGAGGQALGLEQAGFEALALVENDIPACETLRANRPNWNVICGDVREFSAKPFEGVDLFAGGVPCPPFSMAGKQLGELDERDLFPEALRLIKECNPKAVMLENVRGFLHPSFENYRKSLKDQFESMGYQASWILLNSSDFGVPQLRPRVVIVAMKHEQYSKFHWPMGDGKLAPTVGEVLFPLMSQNGWTKAGEWRDQASSIAPTLVGGSKKHGGADLGPTRARLAWAKLGVNGKSLADAPPEPDFEGVPRLTAPMAALIQGFPPSWKFMGKKTPAYRQIGNAFPPPVAKAVGIEIAEALRSVYADRSPQKQTQNS